MCIRDRRSVEAFSSDSSDDGIEFVEDRTKRSLAVSFRSKRTLNNRVSGNISMAGTEYGGASNIKDQAKLYRSMQRTMSKGNMLKKSGISRTDLKLIEKGGDQPVKATIIYVSYTILKASCFVFAAWLYA